jgi:hypothetical protein
MTTGRNERCPCGSGLRYKACHGRAVAQVRKVDFVLGGTQKGGTTALAEYFVGHLDICMPRSKEAQYFNQDEHFAAVSPDHTRYHANFEPGPLHRVLGDATPEYMYWVSTPERIARYNPAMKWIILLRDPVRRAYSHWNMEVSRGYDDLSFDEAIFTEQTRIAVATARQRQRWSYVDRGFYSRQLARIWRFFPRAQTLVLQSDVLRSDHVSTLGAIATFLGVRPFAPGSSRDSFSLPYARPMSDEARKFLRRVYADEISELEGLLGWDLSGWRKT